jgi:hypothetical protein
MAAVCHRSFRNGAHVSGTAERRHRFQVFQIRNLPGFTGAEGVSPHLSKEAFGVWEKRRDRRSPAKPEQVLG